MKTNHCDPSSDSQQGQRLFQPLLQNLQFPVHGNPQRLEGSSGRVNTPAARTPDPFHQRGKFSRGPQRRLSAMLNNDPRNFSCVTLFAVLEKDARKVFLFQFIDQLRGGRRLLGIHSHVKRTVVHETEPARGIAELVR